MYMHKHQLIYRITFILVLIGLCCTGKFAVGQKVSPFQWKSDTLLIHDKWNTQAFLLKKGALRPLYLRFERNTEKSRTTYNPKEALVTVPDSGYIAHQIKSNYVPATSRTDGYHEMEILVSFAIGDLIYHLKVYDGCPGIEWRLKARGNITQTFAGIKQQDDIAIEDVSLPASTSKHYFHLPFHTPHYRICVASLRDITDHYNNLVQIDRALPYQKEQFFSGNVLTATDPTSGHTSLIVKQSPRGYAQSAYLGYDFAIQFNGVKTFSTGFEYTGDTQTDEWHHAYPLYVLLFADNEEEALLTYKQYELTVNRYIPASDNTFTMNTWGNRNRDSRINEAFILNELDAAHKLGITHYQIDDGWQQGLSQNSAQKNAVLWDDWSADDWQVNKERFPHGLTSIQEKAASKGMQLGLWFNPSKKDNYAAWQRDRNIITNLHHQYRISWVKIDGAQLGNRTAELQFTDMLTQAQEMTDGELQFNMDVTAGKRGGYFFLNRVGNIFLENRYTDWGNFYPHFALRNAWQLSRYTPLQRIQVEWLDKWRNKKKYADNDPLKPSEVPFDYQFAITMMAQPLAWMEATALLEQAFDVKPLIDVWKRERSRMQSGVIHPIGKEPNGFGFTGFVSITDDRMYVLVFRELTPEAGYTFALPKLKRNIGEFHRLWGNAEVEKKASDELAFQVDFQKNFEFLWGYFNLLP